MGSSARSVSEAAVAARFVIEPRPGEVLRRKVSLAAHLVLSRAPSLESRPDIEVWLPELLYRGHCFARAGATLLSAALLRVEELGCEDRVGWGMRDYLRDRIPLERERAACVLEDLEVLGRQRAAVLARVPPVTIANATGAQYYWIQHYHPVAVLAYLALLEHAALPLTRLEPLVSSSRLPPQAFRSLLAHARLDRSKDPVYAVLDRLPLTVGQKRLLGINVFETAAMLNLSLHELFELAPPLHDTRRVRRSGRQTSTPERKESIVQTRLDARTPRRPKLPAAASSPGV